MNNQDNQKQFTSQPRPQNEGNIKSVRGSDGASSSNDKKPRFQAPSITMPKGGGAIQGIGEKFQANPVTGTGSMSVPIAMSPGRGGFTPQLALSYDSGAGNSPFGLGWDVGLPQISRKTSKGLPQYDGLPKYEDAFESDVFLLSGAEDLIPTLNSDGSRYTDQSSFPGYTVFRYRPRIEGLFARIEKWVDNNGNTHWRSITKENITTIYGQSPNAKIADPSNSRKVFTWLIEKTWDDKGNVIVYDYKKEDGQGLSAKPIYERNRDASNAYPQSYLKRVFYGNAVPFQEGGWLFELVLDYGEHPNDTAGIPSHADTDTWPIRPDSFSSFRSGFEIRTYRLCRRILMFHHFEAEIGIKNCLVKATVLEHDENPIASLVKSVQHVGYRWEGGAYLQKAYPPVSFDYTKAKVDHTIYSIHAEDLPNAPEGIGNGYQFIDLEGEGLSGILKQNGTAWYYKRNLGGGSFGPQQLVATVPSVAANANVQITDFGGDGLTDVLVQTETLNGYYELNEENEWSNFKPLANPVNFDLNDPSLRMIDLDGNGIPDILITENDCFVWYPSDALDGYKASRRVSKALDEESGPRVVFKEAFQTIFLADMKGDGMTDIVRIRNGEVSYWANMGYGRFSPKITMAHAPHFDYPDQFDPARLRLLDVDGTGAADLLYLGRDEINYWLNESGNGWGKKESIKNFPRTTQLHNVATLDLLGNGTSCIVWSSPLPAEANTPIKYIKILGDTKGEGNKPYLLREVNNNMGAITRLRYDASTKFYLEDEKQGKPWITKLPFPVQVLVRQEVQDEIAGNHFVTRHAYHHGYFDKVEREFRGFGMVEQWDTEDYESLSQNSLFEHIGQNWSEQHDVPPIYTKTWFHNGFYKQGGKISRQYESEYYKEDPDAWLLTDTEMPQIWNPLTQLYEPEVLTPEEKREAARALKGRPLRVEVYGRDGIVGVSEHPYTVAETKYHIKTIQNKSENRHASFYVCECETLSYHYERNPADPRIAHQHTLEIDAFGNVLKSAAIVYPRHSPSIYPEQKIGYVSYSEADFINKPDEADWYRIGVPFAQRSYEVTGLNLVKPYEKEALKLALLAATEIPFEQTPTIGIQKRLLASAKSSFYKDDLSGELPFGEIASNALPYHAYEAAYTQGLIDLFEKDGTVLVTAADLENEGGFLKMDGLWWRTSGRAAFDPAHFFLPIKQFDPYGHEYRMDYDSHYLAMTATSTQAYGKTIASAAELDYQTLQPRLLTDPNGNRQVLLFDPLGMVIAAAVMGKVGENIGDTLDNYSRKPDPTPTYLLANPHDYLQGATTYFHYDLFHWKNTGQPNYAASLVRETHGDPASKTQINFAYSDGFGQTIMAKVQAEPGDAMTVQNGQLVTMAANPRWVGNGRTVFNNKGKPVKQYEPYFSTTHEYETETELVEYGVTPILHYDPLGRNIRTDLPDGTFTKVEFTPWVQRSFDQNDTVLESDWYKRRTDPARPDYIPDAPEQRAALLAKAHANTPAIQHLDTLGRVFLMQEHNGFDTAGSGQAILYDTRLELDILGNQRRLIDALGRAVVQNHFNMVAEVIHTQSMDAGRRWSLSNILEKPVATWDERGHAFRYFYDELQRPSRSIVGGGDGALPLDHVFDRVEYGETQTDAVQKNLLGQVFRHYDTGGLLETPAYDFKGQPISTTRRLFKKYKEVANWSDTNLVSDLEAEAFTFVTETDALGRISRQTAPDGSIVTPSYNRAGVLDGETVLHPESTAAVPYLKKIEYNEKGQRLRIKYGNDVLTKFEYDPKTFRLQRLETLRQNGDPLQDWRYTYDPVGNIVQIEDRCIPTVFFDNQKITGVSEYAYDALYRLVDATGRENNAALNFNGSDNWNDASFMQALHSGDPMSMRRYNQSYQYDAVGNILQMRHQSPGNNWTRNYAYQTDNNRLLSTSVGATTYHYPHHALHGFMTALPHLEDMGWNFKEEIIKTIRQRRTDGGSPETTFYQYDAEGQRLRKITENTASPDAAPTRKEERIYIAGYEVFKKHSGADAGLVRRSLSLLDEGTRFVMAETRNEVDDGTEKHLVRYQLHNHLGSAAMELDAAALVISYEEYHPYGTTAYQVRNAAVRAAAKRYRYTGMERDEESGLEYHSARYYLPWLGRWCSSDPIGVGDGVNLYAYAGNKPIVNLDKYGKQAERTHKIHTHRDFTGTTFFDKLFGISERGKYFKNTERSGKSGTSTGGGGTTTTGGGGTTTTGGGGTTTTGGGTTTTGGGGTSTTGGGTSTTGGGTSTTGGGTAAAPPVGRVIRVTGWPTPITVYGTFSPQVETALNDRWLSRSEIFNLNSTLPNTGTSYGDRDDLFKTLVGRYPGNAGGNIRNRDERLTYQSLQGYVDLPPNSLNPTVVNRYTHWLKQPVWWESFNTVASRNFIITNVANSITNEPNIAPDDQQNLRGLQYLRSLGDRTTTAPVVSRFSLIMPGTMVVIPTLTPAQFAQLDSLEASNNYYGPTGLFAMARTILNAAGIFNY